MVAHGGVKSPSTAATIRQATTLPLTYKRNLDTLIAQLSQATTTQFVCCIRPNDQRSPGKFDNAVVAQQLGYLHLPELAAIHTHGLAIQV